MFVACWCVGWTQQVLDFFDLTAALNSTPPPAPPLCYVWLDQDHMNPHWYTLCSGPRDSLQLLSLPLLFIHVNVKPMQEEHISPLFHVCSWKRRKVCSSCLCLSCNNMKERGVWIDFCWKVTDLCLVLRVQHWFEWILAPPWTKLQAFSPTWSSENMDLVIFQSLHIDQLHMIQFVWNHIHSKLEEKMDQSGPD